MLGEGGVSGGGSPEMSRFAENKYVGTLKVTVGISFSEVKPIAFGAP